MRQTVTSVATAAGDMRAIVRYPDAGGPLPGIVLVDGSGDSAADDWGSQPATFGDCGAVVLTHDKPGCGGSPGDWREQTIADRASDSLAALAVLRRHPGVDQDRVGFLGISQGGWVAYLAASLAPQDVAHLVAISGPAVSAAEQERYRIGCAVDGDAEALAWVDQRTRRLLPGEDPAAIIASQLEFADRPWYALACGDYVAELLPFFVGLAGLDPAVVLPEVRCPVFAAFGGADTLVPVRRSIDILNDLLPGDSRHALAVFPGVPTTACGPRV